MAAADDFGTIRAEAHGGDDVRVPPQAAHFLSRMCANETYAPIKARCRDDVAGGSILHAVNNFVKACRAPSARSMVVPQDQIHDVGLAVEQPEQPHPKHDARAVAVPGCTARGAVARRQVAGLPMPGRRRRRILDLLGSGVVAR
jgi:hypothetical protein